MGDLYMHKYSFCYLKRILKCENHFLECGESN